MVIKKENLRVPQDQITKLHQDCKETSSADLFIASDSKGNLRYIVKVGTSSKMFTSSNSFCNQGAGTKENPIWRLFGYSNDALNLQLLKRVRQLPATASERVFKI